jgi:hypothetical protein
MKLLSAGGWVGLRAGLDTEATGKILSPLPGIEPRSPGRSARNQTLYCLSYPLTLSLVGYHSKNRELSKLCLIKTQL